MSEVTVQLASVWFVAVVRVVVWVSKCQSNSLLFILWGLYPEVKLLSCTIILYLILNILCIYTLLKM